MRFSAIGWKAHAALARTQGRVRLLAALTESIYLTADEEIVWLGLAEASLHPRAVLVATALPAPIDALTLDVGTLRPWRPSPCPSPSSPLAVIAAARALLVELRRNATTTPPLGLGLLLVGEVLPFPLDAAVPRAMALTRACESGDAATAAEAATALLGLGPGLTPSGDDFVGGAFFARRVLAAASGDDDWTLEAATMVARARERTHPISVALLSDMVAGHGHEPLHDLATSLASGAATGMALAAAHRLGRIGHSSGWDILAGVLAAILGRSAFPIGGAWTLPDPPRA